MQQDLRSWLAAVADAGELAVVHGAHWHLEIGTLCEVWGADAQALLFDEITGYRPGLRVLTNALMSPGRLTRTLGLPVTRDKMAAVRIMRQRLGELKKIPPRLVETGPVLENVRTGDEVDLFAFPVPWWHERDGGRYIGTGTVCVTRDPDTGWVNLGTYRCQVHDRNTTGITVVQGKHGLMIMQKYWAQGKPAPVAISVGHHPLLFIVAGTESARHGESEYDVAGGFWNEPVDVVAGPHTGLPIPACAELVLEGEVYGDERHVEGPHAEWTGYYASGEQDRHVLHVRSICYRHDPIILGATPGIPPSDNTYFRSPFKSAAIWDQLEKAGVPGVKAVWSHECAGGRMLVVVGIEQLFPGHAKMAGHIAAYVHQSAYANRMVIVVDHDVDLTNLEEVMWVVTTRADFRWGVDISHRNWTSPLDPSHYPEDEEWDVFNSRMIIDACRPWERRKEYPPIAVNGPEMRKLVSEKFRDLLAQRQRMV